MQVQVQDHIDFESSSIRLSTLEDLAKKFQHVSAQSGMGSGSNGKRHSLLNRIRSATQHSQQLVRHNWSNKIVDPEHHMVYFHPVLIMEVIHMLIS